MANGPFLFGVSRLGFYYVSIIPVILLGLFQLIKAKISLDFNFIIIYTVFIISMLLSEFYADSKQPSYQVYHWATWLNVISFFSMIILYQIEKFRKYSLLLVTYGGFVISLLTISRYLANKTYYTISRGIEFTDPNYMGVAVAMSTVVAFNLLVLQQKPSWNKSFYVAGLLINIGAIIILSSRGSLLSVGVSVLCCILFTLFLGSGNKSKDVCYIKNSITVLLIVFCCFLINGKISMLDTNIMSSRINSTLKSGDTANRTEITSYAMESYFEQPIMNKLFGNGTGMGQVIIARYISTISTYYSRVDAHNSFVTMLLDYGLLGLISWLCLVGYSLMSILRRGKQRVVLLGLWVCVVMASLSLSVFMYGYVWFAFALIVVVPTNESVIDGISLHDRGTR